MQFLDTFLPEAVPLQHTEASPNYDLEDLPEEMKRQLRKFLSENGGLAAGSSEEEEEQQQQQQQQTTVTEEEEKRERTATFTTFQSVLVPGIRPDQAMGYKIPNPKLETTLTMLTVPGPGRKRTAKSSTTKKKSSSSTTTTTTKPKGKGRATKTKAHLPVDKGHARVRKVARKRSAKVVADKIDKLCAQQKSMAKSLNTLAKMLGVECDDE